MTEVLSVTRAFVLLPLAAIWLGYLALREFTSRRP